MTILEFLCLSGLLVEYDVHSHVPSDVGVDHLFLPPSSCETQTYLENVATWTTDNLMKLNEGKSSYMLFSRIQQEFKTSLSLNNVKLDQLEEVRLLGVIITDNLKWDANTSDICKRAFARVSMITKLKYVGVCKEDLLEVYCLFVRSLLEYCSVVWHSTLTLEQSSDIERVQKISLKIILGDQYTGYSNTLKLCNLQNLSDRRKTRCLNYKLTLKHQKQLFPLNKK